MQNVQADRFPQFSVIGRCLQLVQSQKVEHFVIVTPVWPRQNMVSPITDTLHRLPCSFASSERPVDMRGHEPSPLSTATSWVATINSSYQTGDFLAKLETCSLQLGGKTPQVHIPQPGTSGLAGALNDGLLISFHHL